ncbi:YjfA family protein [Streptomyces sp. NPDC008222]
MARTRHRALPIAALLVTATAAVTTTAVPASAQTAPSASPTCHGPTCEGQDPRTTRCSADARSVFDEVFQGRVIRLRYSETCRAAWAQLWNGQPGDVATVRGDGGRFQLRVITTSDNVYTPMVNDMGVTAKACVRVLLDEKCTDSW